MSSPSPNNSQLPIFDWGLIPYQEAFARQKKTVDEILSGASKEQIVFCSHPPVVTLGRGTRDGDLFGWTGEVVDVNRGGRATYHGPNQLVMYPMVYVGKADSKYSLKSIKETDLHAYMRALEASVIDVLAHFGIQAQAQPLQKQVGEDSEKEATGVWINDKKIAAIGIAVKAWITSHGVALNLWNDENAFKGIHPCGFRGDQVTTLEAVLGRKVERREVLDIWSTSIQKRLLL